jgi:GST-like protein
MIDPMIDLHYWPTPNGWKISIMLEECGLPYAVKPVNIGRGEQFSPAFLELSPNNRMPAIVDHDPPGGGKPVAVFESAAILQYLAEKTGRFMPGDVRGKYEVLQWLAWQVANLGPIAGQLNHFANYAAEKIAYPIERFTNEMNRLLGVLERRLTDRSYLAGEYSIADMATWPWIFPEFQGRKVLTDFPQVARWWDAVASRPAVKKGRAVGEELRRSGPLDDEARKVLFGQTAASVTKAEKDRGTTVRGS